MRLGPLEIGLILLVILIIFGPGKLPQVGQALGRGLRQFTRARSGEDEEGGKKAPETSKDESKKVA